MPTNLREASTIFNVSLLICIFLHVSQIQTPSGAYANVYVYSWGMNVNLRVLGQDLGKTEGLCGTYDNNRENDLKLQNSDTVVSKFDTPGLDNFIQSWR